MKKILILGSTGMLGHVLFTQLSTIEEFDVYATARPSADPSKWFEPELLKKMRKGSIGVNADNFDTVMRAFAAIQPDIVINCIGLIKQLPMANDPLSSITVNSLLPHRISMVCRSAGARMIHIGTDCVFNGRRGSYMEKDTSDAEDLYGRSKFLGEVTYPPHCVTLRTSIIGHELKGKHGLVEWFLSQNEGVQGYANAIYTGFPTIEMARIIADYVLPNEGLTGLYHVSSDPISKYDLLQLVSDRYHRKTVINRDESVCIDRSLDSAAFRKAAGYTPPSWPELIDRMHSHYKLSSFYGKKE